MFIKNYTSINTDNIITVNEITKSYLISCGYSPLSYDNDKWIFRKTTHLLNILKSIEKGGENIGR